MNYEGDCRIASATPGLLNILQTWAMPAAALNTLIQKLRPTWRLGSRSKPRAPGTSRVRHDRKQGGHMATSGQEQAKRSRNEPGAPHMGYWTFLDGQWTSVIIGTY